MKRKAHRKGELPITRNEDVEFSNALADEDDVEALERAANAEERVKNDQQGGGQNG